MADVNRVLVSRVLRLYDPWSALGLKRRALATALRCRKVRMAATRGWRPPDARDVGYHAPRVLAFVFRLRAGEQLDPITFDNSFDRWSLTGLVLIDGHHRLIAAAVTRHTTVSCSYSGRVDLLEWLEGKRRLRPPELR